MRDKYPYLRDPRALAEIRKHKWIESQKVGTEIGFATAAVDWVKKYGEQWKRIHVKEYKDNKIFIEQRKYRRFELSRVTEFIKDNVRFLAESINLSLFGLFFRTTKHLSLGSEIKVDLSFEQSSQKKLLCRGMVERVFQIKSDTYEVFVRFDDYSQREIENWQCPGKNSEFRRHNTIQSSLSL